MGLDASHALAIKRAPGTFAFEPGNGEVPAADDIGLLAGAASAFNFAGIFRVELQGAQGAISLEELHADDAGASVKNELANLSGLVHGEEEGGKLSLRCTMIAPFAALVQPLNDQRCLWKDKAFIF